MLNGDKIEDAFRYRSLLPAQWEEYQRTIVRDARVARSRALGNIFSRARAATRTVFARIAGAAGRAVRAYAVWRAKRRAVRELHALGDRTLKDLGMHRSEIESVVYGPASSRVTEGKVAAKFFHKPFDQRRTRTTPAPITRKAA